MSTNYVPRITMEFFGSATFGGEVATNFHPKDLSDVRGLSSQDKGSFEVRVTGPSRVAAHTLLQIGGKTIVAANQEAVEVRHIVLPHEDMREITKAEYIHSPGVWGANRQWAVLLKAIEENPATNLDVSSNSICGDFAWGLTILDVLGRSSLVGSTNIKHILNRRLNKGRS